MKRILFALALILSIAAPTVALANAATACCPSDPGFPPD